MSDSGEEITVDNHTNVQKPKDTNEFSAVDAVSLFNTKIDIALDKQRSSIVSELQEKLQVNTDIKGEGIKIQFSFNQERLSNLDRFKNYLSRGSVEEVFELIDSEKKALTHRNKLLRIADRHGWGTVKEYSDNDLTDNSEDASSYGEPSFDPRRGRLPMPEINPHNHLFSVLDQEFSTACLITSFFSLSKLRSAPNLQFHLMDHKVKE
ncbi:organic solute transporter subunit alpha [Mytilus galloprovincialis]|uniref:Organic solute transporter subunit alpha n=1 Tax=Mytilus galloprovincialis TaxID=29158 RepID=A0A8B6EQD5_MYTGA|nr:organic solute transporter subunit alpha [Mytilus galloprovincialis]